MINLPLFALLIALNSLVGSIYASPTTMLTDASDQSDTALVLTPLPSEIEPVSESDAYHMQGPVRLLSATTFRTMINSSVSLDFRMYLTPWHNSSSAAANFLLDRSKLSSNYTSVYIDMPEYEAACLTYKPANAARGLWVGNVPCVLDPIWNPEPEQWLVRYRNIHPFSGYTFSAKNSTSSQCIAPSTTASYTDAFTEVSCDSPHAIWVPYY
ncbi:hypothetical protein BJ684DRAFT_16917 [Piptocephalis cylindrospora]|uniref:Uncharacterized protein n=1 Tax=Piptocephalis cylindrospora TaxID=1907219 RepID=A0A4P9Y233_9FUNG|nr:hypothetical protein BJ684DRAFT_16917 [Piptocephalis cylindrospora]|eukprot:RKP12612.1 hypothetical protein BJ684DRAFT_16917 [Piptocephalis cylindrospora]